MPIPRCVEKLARGSGAASPCAGRPSVARKFAAAARCRCMTGRRNGMLVAIALFRLAKALALLLLGLGALRLLHPGVARSLRIWFAGLPFVTEHAAVDHFAATVARLPPTRIEE